MDPRSGREGGQLQDQSRLEKYSVAERRKLRGLLAAGPLCREVGHMPIHQPPGR